MIRRVAVTGLGIVSPIGNSRAQFWDAVVTGRSGIGPVPVRVLPEAFPAETAGTVRDFSPRAYGITPKALKVMNGTIQYAIAAAHMALQEANLSGTRPDAGEIGLYLGVEGLQYTAEELLVSSFEAVGRDMHNYFIDAAADAVPIRPRDPALAIHPLWPLSVLPNMALCHVAIQNDIQGRNVAFSSLDSGGVQAIGEAFEAIRAGDGDVYLAGGSYELNSMHLLSFAARGMLSRAAKDWRLFDGASSGGVLGEGAAVLVLEEHDRAVRRGAPVLAEISGYAMSFSGSSPAGEESPADAGECIRRALAQAGAAPSEIGCVMVDATGIATVDLAAARCLSEVFGGGAVKPAVTTTAGLTGHMLTAAGAVHTLEAVLAVHDGRIPPAAGVTGPVIDDCPAPATAVSFGPGRRQALTYTYGLTGEHTALVINEYSEREDRAS